MRVRERAHIIQNKPRSLTLLQRLVRATNRGHAAWSRTPGKRPPYVELCGHMSSFETTPTRCAA